MVANLPLNPTIEVTVASHGMSKGIEQADGPQVTPRAYVQMGDIQVGGQWKNITSRTADGESWLFAGLTRKVGAFQLSVGANYKFQTGTRSGLDADAIELNAGAGYKSGKLSLKASMIYAPDDIGSTKRSLYVEGGPAIDFTKTLRVSANIGRRNRERAPDYTSLNIGATQSLFRGFALDLRYYRTDRSDLGSIYRDRLVLAGRWSF